MPVQTIPVSMNVPKEGKEIVDAAFSLVKHFKSGGTIEQAVTLVPSIMAAVDNFKAVNEEVQSEYRDELAAYVVQKIGEILS